MRQQGKEREGLFYLVRPAAGGMLGHLRELMACFGESCRLHLAAPGRELADLAERSGGRFYHLPLTAAFRPRADLGVCRELGRFLHETRPVLLHAHGIKAALVGGITARFMVRTALLVTMHNFPADAVAAGPLLAPAWRFLCGPPTRFIAVSRALSETLCRWGVDPSRISVIPNGIDAARFGTAAQRRRLAGRRAVVGTVARLAPQKGVAVFLKAAAELAARFPTLFFRVVGEGPERPALEALATKLGLDGRVEFRGFRKDLPAELGAMDVFVLPSLTEGLSIALLEAAAAACPVVVSRCGGLPEIITDGVTGLLVPPGDPHALAGGVAKLLHRPAEARRMATAAVSKVQQKFSRAAMLRRTGLLYQEMGVLSRHRLEFVLSRGPGLS